MESSYLMTKYRALETFPMLKSDGLVGALVYYDGTSSLQQSFANIIILLTRYYRFIGQHNDSRMNTALIMTAVKYGAIVANHCEVTELHKASTGKLNGARLKDNLTGKEWDIQAKVRLYSSYVFTGGSNIWSASPRELSMLQDHSPTPS